MLDIFEQFATDPTLENEGVWVPHGGAKFLIARTGNSKYAKLLTSLAEKNQTLLDMKNEEADKISDEIMIEVMAKTVLLGWEGVSYKRNPLEYSPENAMMLLRHRDFRVQVTKWATDQAAYRAKLAEEQLGN